MNTLLTGLFALLLLHGAALSETMCRPPSAGPPCGFGSLASQADSEPQLSLGAGNPIHLATGNKYQLEPDLPPNVHHPLLEFTRHYNSLDRRVSMLGQGWASSLDTRVHDVAGLWQIVQADGGRKVFAGTSGLKRGNRHGTLERQPQGWRWTWPDQRELRFDALGRLTRVTSPSDGHKLVIERHTEDGPLKGHPHTVYDEKGIRLSFHYRTHSTHAYLDALDTPLGRFHYRYEQASPYSASLRLTAMTRPDGMQRRYLHEPAQQAGNPFLLTGIKTLDATGVHAVRTNRWSYDAGGRAVSSAIPGAGKHHDLRIEYQRPAHGMQSGQTIVQDAQGNTTRFRIALQGDRYRLLDAQGSGCPGCPAPGSRARYDIRGNAIELNGLILRRYPSGTIRQLAPQSPGWPGLILNYGESGLRTAWHTVPTGTERSVHDSRQRLLRRSFSNGDAWAYHYDVAGRLTSVEASGAAGSTHVRVSWSGGRPSVIEHPSEHETRRHDDRGNLVHRLLDRPLDGRRHRFEEHYAYDAQGHLIHHRLAEGGALHFTWRKNGSIEAIHWTDSQGDRHTVIKSLPGRNGYRHGNGLWAQTAMQGGRAQSHAVQASDGRTLWRQELGYDAQGRIVRETLAMPVAARSEHWHYTHDPEGRLIGAQRHDAATDGNASLLWYAWRDDGSLAASRKDGSSIKPQIERDDSGLPQRLGNRALSYGPARRLAAVEQDGRVLAQYEHNAFGQRIRVRAARHDIDYFYRGNTLAAEAMRQRGLATIAITRRYIHANLTPVAFIDYTPEAPYGRLYAIHADLQGAPRLVTDARGGLRWAASYSPTGEATRIAGDMALDLRLPGQVEDTVTGWHDNLLRTYLPRSGHFLEPDPLGPTPGSQALGYARQQPRQYADPLGLLLFAFDGTRNTPDTQTNVWKLSQRYLDGPIFYHSGPGNPGSTDWDSITAYSAARILDTQWKALLTALSQPSAEPGETTPIDIIGFSRGAALARHFANLLEQHVDQGLFRYQDDRLGLVSACVDLRFMGLFDTVAQFGLNGMRNKDYNLAIAPAWGWVAHAVALQEYRRYFPLNSVGGTLNTVEAPFIGAHADIGGGVGIGAPPEAGSGDLSDVALNWMLWQARAMTVRFDDGPPEQAEITRPIVHDQRSTGTRPQAGDRRIDAPDGSVQYRDQALHPRLGKMQRDVTEPLIRRNPGWQVQTSNEVGLVDMEGYARWLRDELGWQPPAT